MPTIYRAYLVPSEYLNTKRSFDDRSASGHQKSVWSQVKGIDFSAADPLQGLQAAMALILLAQVLTGSLTLRVY